MNHDDPLDELFAQARAEVQARADRGGRVRDFAAMIARAHAIDPTAVPRAAVEEAAEFAPVVVLRRAGPETAAAKETTVAAPARRRGVGWAVAAALLLVAFGLAGAVRMASGEATARDAHAVPLVGTAPEASGEATPAEPPERRRRAPREGRRVMPVDRDMPEGEVAWEASGDARVLEAGPAEASWMSSWTGPIVGAWLSAAASSGPAEGAAAPGELAAQDEAASEASAAESGPNRGTSEASAAESASSRGASAAESGSSRGASEASAAESASSREASAAESASSRGASEASAAVTSHGASEASAEGERATRRGGERTGGERASGKKTRDAASGEAWTALDRAAREAWRRGDLDEARALLGALVRSEADGARVEMAYGDLFVLTRQAGDAAELARLWRGYLARFPRGLYAEDARAGLCRREQTSQAACWQRYLETWPTGAHVDEARAALEPR